MPVMPEVTPPDVPHSGGIGGPDGLERYKHWKPEYQQAALEQLRRIESSGWRPFYCKNRHCNGEPHEGFEFQHAREDQWPPEWNKPWFVWLMRSGRGAGKTRTGAEVVNRAIEMYPRIALGSPTGALLRATLVEGEAGILATAPPGKLPKWEPSKKQLTFHNGCIAQGFSGEEPERLRSFEHAMAWLDEPAHYDDPDRFWTNLLFGMRMKLPVANKIICTTTPLPNKWIKEIMAKDSTIVTRVSTYANLQNLSDTYRREVVEPFEGTRTGQQELHGEILEDTEGSLWKWEMFRWLEEGIDIETLDRIVVGLDPAGTANKRSDETGIIVVGVKGDMLYVLEDLTGKYSPDGWARAAHGAYESWSADAIVVEKTYGQDITLHVLESSGYSNARIIPVESRRGKAVRAEPVVALYEKKRVRHVGKRGTLLDLEEEQTSWVPGHGASPNRVDALVHAATELARVSMPASIANPNTVLRGRMAPKPRHLRAV